MSDGPASILTGLANVMRGAWQWVVDNPIYIGFFATVLIVGVMVVTGKDEA